MGTKISTKTFAMSLHYLVKFKQFKNDTPFAEITIKSFSRDTVYITRLSVAAERMFNDKCLKTEILLF